MDRTNLNKIEFVRIKCKISDSQRQKDGHYTINFDGGLYNIDSPNFSFHLKSKDDIQDLHKMIDLSELDSIKIIIHE